MTENDKKTDLTLDQQEVDRFAAMAAEWWDPRGKFRPLHQISAVRLGFFREEICRHFGRDIKDVAALGDLTLLDIGCGGGLVSEPLAKQGAKVTGIDPATNNIEAAKSHARAQGVDIDYRACRAEDLVEAGETFDVVMVLEVVEHVPDVKAFVALCSKLVKPGGLMILSTINRTMKSFALAIVGAEYILRWLPKGTHQWDKFVTLDELEQALTEANMRVRDSRGMFFNPFANSWSLSDDRDVNYFMVASKAKA